LQYENIQPPVPDAREIMGEALKRLDTIPIAQEAFTVP
jgi:hypothetical protein